MALKNGNVGNTHGRGGPLGALAREAVPSCLARLSSIIDAASAATAGPTIDAAELVLRHRSGAADQKAAAIAVLRKLVDDARTPHSSAVRAAGLLMARAQGELA